VIISKVTIAQMELLWHRSLVQLLYSKRVYMLRTLQRDIYSQGACQYLSHSARWILVYIQHVSWSPHPSLHYRSSPCWWQQQLRNHQRDKPHAAAWSRDSKAEVLKQFYMCLKLPFHNVNYKHYDVIYLSWF